MEEKGFMYEAPKIEVIEVEVEKGFANSNTATLEYGETSEWEWE